MEEKPREKEIEKRKPIEIPFAALEFAQEPLGEGGFGKVWKGKYNGSVVAIKQISFFGRSGQDLSKYIQREITIITDNPHPCIVQCFGISIQEDSVYIVTEFIEQGDLAKNLHSGFTLTEMIQLLKDVASAMYHLHEHRT